MKDAQIEELQEELRRLREEVEVEKAQRAADDAERREQDLAEAGNRHDDLRKDLSEILGLINQQREAMEEKKQMCQERDAGKEERRMKKENDKLLHGEWLQTIMEKMEECKGDLEKLKTEGASKTDLERIVEQLRQQNEEQQRLLKELSDTWRADCAQHHEATLRTIEETANQRVPYNVQGYLDEFSRALATEVRILLGEVGKLREEKRGLQHEIGFLLCTRSKYGPGGEFDADWKPPSQGPLGPQQPPPPPPAPELPPEVPPARPGWRNVSVRRSRKKKEAAPGPPPSEVPHLIGPPGGVDARHQVRSWSTWQPDPANAPTPPSVEPTLLVPDQGSPGLFGPRSPNTSIRGSMRR
ncbi:hypothetical protein CPB85DRAFT_268353 [Mucidula mucida]|nr:hypothetical protein CPB85DRAFT_268353 [Mucidula mucida]